MPQTQTYFRKKIGPGGAALVNYVTVYQVAIFLSYADHFSGTLRRAYFFDTLRCGSMRPV